ncbi:hypothetical protein ADK86_26130 [Streptomyces sp. NRRL F-5755]|uniref:hypothetical protein n=1 Tax=Streptomyces sp. NRRL F-5755 TaxID=1519475 RepID=UPI0006AE5813|nr:hypothetical protein [Streptomyces sp. NRRL F-5755]KOT90388.1 hypothetical protein ADK86_26130 [Streptomyces sp. NRRL F-5755]
MATARSPETVDPDVATEALRDALMGVGIVLPSLAADAASDLGLVSLGRVRAAVAMRLADVVRQKGGAHA